MLEVTRFRWTGLLCGTVVVVLILAVRPFAELGLIDDWSYIRTVQVFAQTGHIVYNGWATAMLGWQIVWAALFVKILGFSFTVVRLSMLPFAIGAVALLHDSMIRFGISTRNAVFGSLAFGLSPLFVTMTPTFMTDIGGVFFILLCFDLCLCAVRVQGWLSTVLWLGAASAASVVGGSARQIVWLGALVMVPATAWVLRRRPRVVALSIAFWLLSVVSILSITRWFAAQPYSLPEKLLAPLTWPMVREFVVRYADMGPYMLLITLPVLIAWLPQGRRLRAAAWIRALLLLIAWGALCVVFRHRYLRTAFVMPWMRPVLYDLGMDPLDPSLPGVRGVTLGLPSRMVIGIVVLVAGLVFLEWAWTRVRSRRVQPVAPAALGWSLMGCVAGPFTLAYLCLLVPRALFASFLTDRYLLVLLPFALLALLKLYEEQVGPQLPAVCVVVLALFSLYSLAGTHDWFALQRAHVALADEIQATGVPRSAIQGGAEYDGWTQIMDGGYINDPRLAVPKGAYHPPSASLDPCVPSFLSWTPIVHPEFVITHSPITCLAPSRFSAFTYRTWLPPFRRELAVQSVPARIPTRPASAPVQGLQ